MLGDAPEAHDACCEMVSPLKPRTDRRGGRGPAHDCGESERRRGRRVECSGSVNLEAQNLRTPSLERANGSSGNSKLENVLEGRRAASGSGRQFGRVSRGTVNSRFSGPELLFDSLCSFVS